METVVRSQRCIVDLAANYLKSTPKIFMRSSFSSPKALVLAVLVCVTGVLQAAQLPSRENNTFMAAGHGFSSYLDGDGQVWNSGENNFHQLGCGGSIGYVAVPVKVSGATPATAIATGYSFEVALVNGVPKYWGHGLAGLPDSDVAVAIPGDTTAKAVACAGNHALFLDSDGTMSQITGTGTTIVPVTGPTHVIQIGSAPGCDMYRTDDDVLHALDGADAYGALGLGAVTSITSPATIMTNVVDFSLADHHAMALSGTGQGYSWGKASQNGLGGTSDQTTPAPITSVTHIRQMVCAGSNSFILGSDGQNWGAGENQSGSLGIGNTTPQSAFTLLPVTAGTGLAGDDRHTLIQGSFQNYIAGTVYGVGDNSHGSLSMGNFVSTTYPLPTTFGETSAQSMLAAGDGDSCVLYRGGQIRSVGKNDHGQLGYSTGGADTTTDAPITGVPIFVWVSAGDGFTGAVDINGHAWFWGLGADGELGQNSISDSAVPVMAPLDNVVALALGSGHVIAQLQDGTSVAVWGKNNHYQLGLGDMTNRLVPTTLTLSAPPLSVSAGGDHSTFVLNSGVAQCCGSNLDGECGQGTIVDVQMPTNVSSLSSIIGSASGTTHTWFLDATNHIYHTGSNTFGEAMDGTTSGHLSPVLVGSGAMNIWAGNHTSFWLDQYSDITASGWNGSGLLTNGTYDNNSTGVMAFLWANLMGIGKHHLLSAFDGFITPGGGNSHGELDTGDKNPTSSGTYAQFPAYEVNNNTSLAAGLTFSMQVDELGDLYGYGYGLDGQIGNGGFSQSWIGWISAYNIMQTSAGAHHSVEVDSFGNSFAQGAGSRGQLGNGSLGSQFYPSLVTLPLPALKSFCGNNCTYWLLDDRSLAVSGANAHGALGTGDRVDVTTPIVVLTHVIDVYPGDGFVWVVMDDGTTKAAGRNDLQQCGFSTGGADILTFTTIPSLSNVMTGSAGGSASVAVKGDGTPFTFGTSTLGALGLGTVTTSAPAQMFLSDGVTPVSNITAASMGNGFLALHQSPGTLLMTGDDSFNQFNDSAYTQKNFVQAVTLTAPLSFMSAGGSHLLNQLADGNTENLGSDVFGELGNNTTYSPPPQPPSSVSATLNGSSEIDLAWTPGAGAANQEIDSSIDGGVTWQFVTNMVGTASSYAATGLTPGTTYQFHISSSNSGGVSSAVSAGAGIMIPWVAPTAPTDVSIDAGSPESLVFSWDNGTSDPQNILIQRQNSDGSFTTVATLAPGTTTYTLTGLTDTGAINYQIVSQNIVGSAISAVVSAPVPPPRPRYVVVDLGVNFVPQFISNNGYVTGVDAPTGNAERWNPTATGTTPFLQTLTVDGTHPFVVGGSSVGSASLTGANNSGAVVGTLSQTTSSDTLSAGYYWSPTSNVATIQLNNDITTYSPYNYVAYSAIDDNNVIYGTKLTEALGFTTAGPYSGTDGYYVFPGQTGPLTIPGASGTAIGYYSEYDGFTMPSTEMGSGISTVGTPPTQYQFNNVYPVLASTSVVVTCATSGTFSSTATLYNYEDGGTLYANSTALPAFKPSAVNNLGIVVGATYSDASHPTTPTSAVWWDISHPSTTNVLSSTEGDYITGINSRTTTDSPPVSNFQMVGTKDSLPTLWEKPTPTSTSFVSYPMNALIAYDNGSSSAYTIDSVTGINDAGVIIGTANNFSDGNTHGVMLVPCEIRLLNGDTNTADIDGQDFDGNRPTTMDNPDLDPDNTTTENDITSSGTNVLGDCPMGTGRADPPFVGNSYISSTLVVAKVPSNSGFAITYTWQRLKQNRMLNITKSSDGSQWNVTKVDDEGFPSPTDDTDHGTHQTTAPSGKNILYSADGSGDYMINHASEAVGDYSLLEKKFIYSITVQVGSATTTVNFPIGQFIVAKRNHTTGDVPTDWQGISCRASSVNIPDCQMPNDLGHIAIIRGIVGGPLPISIDSHANDN